MGIFDFLKKLGKGEKTIETPMKKLSFSEIREWIQNKTKENESKEKEIILVVKERIKVFVKELEEKLETLLAFDLESKKEEDKMKAVVEKSRDQYIESAEALIESLNNLKEMRFEVFIKKINKIFFDFNKNSFKNYERATILIGKEMANIRNSFRGFTKEIVNIFKENEKIITTFKEVLNIESKLDEIIALGGKLKLIEGTTLALEKEINSKEEKKKILEREIKKIGLSSDYLEFLETKKKIELLKEELKKDIFSFKQLIDFKALANFFHINEDQIRTVKDHRDNFQINFEKDNGKLIMGFLDEAKLNNGVLLKKMNLIRTKTEKRINYENNLKDDETLKISSQIKDVLVERDNLKIERDKEEKRGEKIKEDKEKLFDLLKKELGRMRVELI